MRITEVDEKNLHSLIPLLSQSAGYAVDFSDELDCLQKAGGFGWFETDETGNPAAFVRCFPISQEVWLIEFYPRNVRRVLDVLKKQIDEAREFPERSFRIDLPESHNAEVELLKSFGFQRIKHFLHFQVDVEPDPVTGSLSIEQARTDDLPYVQELLKELHVYSYQELQDAIMENRFWVVREPKRSQVQAVAKILRSSESINVCELVEFSVDASERGKGIGTRFLRELMQHFRAKDGIRRWELKVESNRSAAIACYRKLGFSDDPLRSQKWLYLDVPAHRD